MGRRQGHETLFHSAVSSSATPKSPGHNLAPPPNDDEQTLDLTLAGEEDAAGETKELLDLRPRAKQALPPRSRAPLPSPSPARTMDGRGPAERRRRRRVALGIAFWGKTVRDEVSTPNVVHEEKALQQDYKLET